MFFGSTKFVFVVKYKKNCNVKTEGNKVVNKSISPIGSAQQVNTEVTNTSVINKQERASY